MNKYILLSLVLLAAIVLPAFNTVSASLPNSKAVATVKLKVDSVATLGATTGDALICTGETTIVTIDLDSVIDLYGYQFEVSYDDSLVNAEGAFVNDFFDADGSGSVPGGPGGLWDATCAGGTCSFAKAEVAPDPPVSGSGALATITLTGVAPGAFDMIISNSVLSDIDGAALAHDMGAPLPISVCGPPRLSARVPSGDALICTGETTTIAIDLDCVADLYGYQFEVSYDDSLVNADGVFVNDFFDADVSGSVPGGPGGPWDATCVGGTCSFAKAEVAPDPPVSGSGALATITLTGVAPGAFDMIISSSVLSDIDGAALAHDLSAPLPITVCGLANISGFITLQGRFSGNVDEGTVEMIEQAPTNFGPISSAISSDTDGAYSLTVPYMAGGSSYQIRARHGLYLDNAKLINVAGELANENTQLWGGDANNSGNISIADLSCIGGALGQSPVITVCGGPPPVPTGSPDINADGVVSIRDLSIAGGNLYKISPQPW